MLLSFKAGEAIALGDAVAVDMSTSGHIRTARSSGDLDEANGRTGVTPEFPNGTYYYVVTDEFPGIPRYFVGTPSKDFKLGPN